MHMWMIHSLLSSLFPPSCIGCGKSDISLCARCIALSRKTLGTPEPFIVSLFDFQDPLIRKSIHAIKYYHRKDLVAPLAAELAKELAKKIPRTSSLILVPIPMPMTRKLLRGYNQAELIAHHIGKILDIPVRTDILARATSPSRQVTMHTRKEREKNQHGSFRVAHDAHDMEILLIDDVMTTGATLSVARDALIKAGAKSVHAATLAH
jgi:ComF family protein